MEKSLENNKRHIKFVATVGNKENIIEELEKRVENPTILENTEQLKKQLESFKNDFNDENYHNSDVFAKYMANKTGKYIVVCMDTKHMHEMIRKTHELFDKVNPNENVSYMGSRMFDSAKEEMIRKFDEFENENGALNLLFLNKATTRCYNTHNVDGVILLCYAKYHTKRNLAIVNEALKSCKDNGVVIQVVDSIDTISKYETLQERVNAEGKYIVDFDKSDSFAVAENFRDATYSKKIDDNFKLELMQEYKQETGKDITFRTMYKGYNLGTWKNNLRQYDSNGKLDIDDELRKKFEKEGILGDRLRRIRTTDEDKYNLLLKFNEKNPDEEITIDTIDENGNPIGEYRSWLQTKVNRKTSQLTQKQISNLKELGYLNLSLNEIKELSEKFKLSEVNIVNIIKEHKSIKKFVSKYKNGKINPKNIKLNKRGIILSKNELTMKQKQAYIDLLEDIYKENVLNDKSKFVIEEEILAALNSLPDKRREIIIQRYGLGDEEAKTYKEIGEKHGKSKQWACNLAVLAWNELSESLKIHSIKDLKKSRDELNKKIEKAEKTDYEEWKRKKLNLDIKVLKLNDVSINSLRENGYQKISDLIGVSKEDLFKIKGFGYRKVYDLIEKVNNISTKLTPNGRDKEIKKLKDKLKSINSTIEYYNNAHNYYMYEEDIFSNDEIIPPSINSETTKSKLSKKKDEKALKQKKIDNLEEDINKQNEKTDILESVLEIKENCTIKR